MILLRLSQGAVGILVPFYLEADVCAVPERASFTYPGAGGAARVGQVEIAGSREPLLPDQVTTHLSV